MNLDDQPFASASQLGALLASGQTSSAHLLDLYLDRIDRHDPALNLVVAQDRAQARAQAEAADRRRREGKAIGPIDGLPITIKECWETACGQEGGGGGAEGTMATSCGIPALRDHRAARDAATVAALRAAGAIIFGKTNLPQGASDWQSFNPVYGLSCNPFDPARSPGGSSGGSAGAVAAGFTSFELGSDIGGSIRIPAHFCGVFGHKPSYGLVPMRGHIPPPPGALDAPDMGTAGPLARAADDLALVLGLVADPDRARLLRPARRTDLGDFRIGVWLGDGQYLLDDGYREMVESCLADLARAGARLESVRLPVDPIESLRIYEHTLFAMVGTWAPGSAAIYAAMAKADETGVAAKLARYADTSLGQWFALREERARLRQAWAEFFTRHDVLLTPQAPVLAFPHMAKGDGAHWEQIGRRIIVNGEPRPYIDFSWQSLALVADLPATCMPCGRLSAEGLPGGLQIVGPHMEDLTTIAFAAAATPAAGGFIPPPALRDRGAFRPDTIA